MNVVFLSEKAYYYNFLHHKLPPCLTVAIAFSTTNYHHIRECSMYFPKQPYPTYHINQFLSHQSVQTIISEIAYTVSNSSPLGKDIMCRTLPWKEKCMSPTITFVLISDMKFPANSSSFMLDFIIVFISQWTCYMMC